MTILDKNDSNYRQCSISVMDNIADPNITFDENGICNYYYEYLKAEKEQVVHGDEGIDIYNTVIDKIKKDGKGKKYDCILGVSGGVDSTYLAYLAKQSNLRVLCVHFDNGWNSELAVKNVQNLIELLGFDLHTLVVDWDEFKDVQLSLLKASVVDVESVTDLAISSTLLKLAIKFKTKYILSGNNIVTENVLPVSWVFKDVRNIIDIQNQFGTKKIKTLPLLNRNQMTRNKFLYKIQFVELLNFVFYNKTDVKKIIIEELGWRDYGGKHYESVFTRFYQGYILPNKFKIDKRKAHLSNLIFSGQISKVDALHELAEPIINDAILKKDKIFVLKKLGLTEFEFEEFMNQPQIHHKHYDHTKPFFEEYRFLKSLKPIWKWLKKK
jgi:N-acetyl sugar amidotransferase